MRTPVSAYGQTALGVIQGTQKGPSHRGWGPSVRGSGVLRRPRVGGLVAGCAARPAFRHRAGEGRVQTTGPAQPGVHGVDAAAELLGDVGTGLALLDHGAQGLYGRPSVAITYLMRLGKIQPGRVDMASIYYELGPRINA